MLLHEIAFILSLEAVMTIIGVDLRILAFESLLSLLSSLIAFVNQINRTTPYCLFPVPIRTDVFHLILQMVISFTIHQQLMIITIHPFPCHPIC